MGFPGMEIPTCLPYFTPSPQPTSSLTVYKKERDGVSSHCFPSRSKYFQKPRLSLLKEQHPGFETCFPFPSRHQFKTKGSQMSRGTWSALTVLLLMAVLTSKAFEVEDIVPGHQVAAQIGEDLELRCRTTGCDRPIFSWRTQLDFPLGANVSHQGSSSVLKMKVGFENEHEYLCNTRCGEVRKQKKVQIDIYSFPSDPVIEISHPLVLGEPATITCCVPKVYPADRLEIYLEIEGEVRRMTEFSREPLIKSVETKSASMTFTPSEEDNGRKITCRAELPIDEMEFEPKERKTTEVLHVNYGPRNTRIVAMPSSTVKEGDTITLSCSTYGSPTPKVFWKKQLLGGGSRHILEGATLTIKAVQAEAMGLYECEAVNMAGNESRSVEIIVEVSSPSTPETSHSTPELSPSTPETSHSTPELSPTAPESSPSTPELSPSTPALTDRTEAVTEVEDLAIKGTTYNTQHQVTDSNGDDLEKETSLATNGRIFTTHTASRNNTITYTVKVDDVGNSTEEDKIVIDRLDYVTPVIIAVSSLATAAGPMAALLIYIFRKAKINGSYSLVNSLKPKV
ncbi:vascular cell adhesion protein 1 isoform X2 [Zootoca vivipara]|uniref:vascular cell adhesion protein 1 isoform X2 n=1 Tax=Zootoca vivipara TaxID=8524 RepID=UPI00293BB97F|nr:vascular cell adhesion protein 1 isoform X2 [Zootoca vivipara]